MRSTQVSTAQKSGPIVKNFSSFVLLYYFFIFNILHIQKPHFSLSESGTFELTKVRIKIDLTTFFIYILIFLLNTVFPTAARNSPTLHHFRPTLLCHPPLPLDSAAKITAFLYRVGKPVLDTPGTPIFIFF